MRLTLADKVAAFCRELGDDSLVETVRRIGLQERFVRAQEAVRDGRVDTVLETELDAIDETLRRIDGDGIYPPSSRAFEAWPSGERDSGARWWACPAGRCVGRGRVLAAQSAPVCSALGRPLEAGPFPP